MGTAADQPAAEVAAALALAPAIPAAPHTASPAATPPTPTGWGSPLEPDRATLAAWGEATLRFGLDHLDGLANAPAQGMELARARAEASAISQPIAEAPLAGGLAAALALIERASAAALQTAGPGYLAYVPGGGLPSAGLADLLAGWTNRYTGLSAAAPARCRLEADVLRWLAGEFGYDPEAARGLLTSGGSLANLAGIVTARHERLGDAGDLRQAVAYASSQIHHSVGKSLRVAGIPRAGLRAVPVDGRLRLRVDALAQMIADDRAAGRIPFLVVSSVGTTNTGAVDPLHAIADLCAREGLWHHADGAYGGAFQLCASGREALAGIARADSICFDPHKGMFLPYGTGCLLVRDGAALRRAHQGDASYLQDLADGTADAHPLPPSPTDHGPELSRDDRGLRLWLSLQLFGAAAFRAALEEKLALAQRLHAGLLELIADGWPIELADAPQLSTVAYRLARRPSESSAARDARTLAWMEATHRRGRVYGSTTRLPTAEGDDATTIRACVLSFRTHAPQIDALLADARAALHELRAAGLV
jgi:aromatic-L-amino-acid decarboxylase